MTREQRAIELRAIVTNTVFKDVLDEIERDALDRFMRLPMEERLTDKGRHLLAHVDALRELRDMLNWHAQQSAPEVPPAT